MNQNEFNRLLNDAENTLRAYAMNLTREREAANDLFQETALKAYKYRAKFRPQSNFRAWVVTLMKNTFINNYRRKKRYQTVFDHTPDQYLLNSSDYVTGNEGEGVVTYKEIIKLVNDLPDKLRIPFLMQYRGYRYEEIAQQLDTPEGTIKSRIHFARKRLKTQVHEQYQYTSLAELVA